MILDWEADADATSYILQVSTSSSFSSYVLNQSGISATQYTVTGLANFTRYYWRVYGVNSYGTGPASSTYAFRTVASSTTGTSDVRCIVIPTTGGLTVGDSIGVTMDTGVVHWTYIEALSTSEGLGTQICLATLPFNTIKVGNVVYLPSLNRERWTS